MIRVVYNPEKDMIGELIPLYTKSPISKHTVCESYSITLESSASRPTAYVVFNSDIEDGYLMNAEVIEKTIASGVIIDLDEEWTK